MAEATVPVQAQCKKELKGLAKEIAQAEGRLKQAATELERCQAAADAVNLKMDQAQRRREVFFSPHLPPHLIFQRKHSVKQ